MRSRIIPALLCAFWTQLLTAEAPRARLQIINGSAQPVDVFWPKSDTGRVPDGSVAPGEDTDITTTIGHWFVLVGRSDGSGSIMDLMLAKRPEVREAMIRRGARLWILWWNDFTTDPLEFARLAAICREVFGDTVLRYTQPQTRLTGHLEGYDPSTAPKVRVARTAGEGEGRDPAPGCGPRRRSERRTRPGQVAVGRRDPHHRPPDRDGARIYFRSSNPASRHCRVTSAVRTGK